MSAQDPVSALPPPRPRPADAPVALQGVRVLDFSRLLAGPFATLLLADLGAEVIKVEHPAGGDDSRALLPPSLGGESACHVWANRNKRSIALDLRLPAGRELARELARQADVVVENFSTGVMERLGLSYAVLSADNPRLIYCSVSAYGRAGRFAGRHGYDPIVQADSGFLSLNGFAGQDPVRTGPSIVDISTGMMACNAVLAALIARARHGRGQFVEAALFDSAVALIGQNAMNHLMTGEEQHRSGNGSNTYAPAGLFRTRDGPVYLSCANDRLFQRLAAEVLGSPDLADDPRYRSNAQRMAHRDALHERLEALLEREPRELWLERAQACGVPMGPVRSIGEAFASEEMRDRGLLSRIPHPSAGAVPNIAAPFRLSGTPAVDPVAAPLLGQDTEAVLRELLGCDTPRLAALRAAGVFGRSGE